MRKITTEDFIARAQLTHKYKYSYENSVYYRSDLKLKINCKIHGEFEQIAANHLDGSGCWRCSSSKKSHEDFVAEANAIHNNKYTYCEGYVLNELKMNIICPNHGLFLQTPHSHLAGRGCIKCRNDKFSINYGKGLHLFVKQANIIHNNKYDYSQVIYKNTHTNVKIFCPIHGNFTQKPLHHLRYHGCSRCSAGSNISRSETAWLDSINVPIEFRQASLKIKNKLIKPDAFNKLTNTVYEFYGNYFHGNPEMFDNNDINLTLKKTFGELYDLTMIREDLIKQAGFNLITIWESDWKKLNKPMSIGLLQPTLKVER